VDERERQRRCRAKRRAKATADVRGSPTSTSTLDAGSPMALGISERGCHAPAWVCRSADFHEKVLESWDRAVAMSRASLKRKMAAISRSLNTISGQDRGVTEAMSRTSLGR
jgi:hypothetical protein